MRVSIAMATYNGARYITEQLESLAAQSMLPFELVVCDDGSSDGTLERVRAFADRAPFPVRIEANASNLGYADNFLKAMGLCTGDLIAFCDQDDVWAADKVQACAREFERPDVTLVFHGYDEVDAALQPFEHARARQGRRVYPVRGLSPWRCVLGFCMMFRADLPLLRSTGARPADFHRPERPMAHDLWATFLATAFGEVVELGASLALYRQHGANVFGTGRSSIVAEAPRDPSPAMPGQVYASLASIADQRAEFLERSPVEAAHRPRAALAAAAYRRQAALLMRRAAVGAADRGASRLVRIGSLLGQGGYGSIRRGGLGLRALGKDLTGVLH
jgi:hypothetical protein